MSADSLCKAIPVTESLVSVSPASDVATVKTPASALFTLKSFEIRETLAVDSQATLLLWSHEKRLFPIAMIATAAGNRARRVEWYSPTAQSPAATAATNLGTMEHLYAFLLRLDPSDRFQFRAEGKQAPSSALMSHSKALATVAAMRTCLAAEYQKLEPSVKITPWRVATIQPIALRNAHGLDVAARVRSEKGEPIAGNLTFSKGVHLSCAADTSFDGSGRCTLFDLHGHDPHDDDHDAKTAVMFSGSVAPDLIVLPTTHVYGGGGRR